LQFHKVVAPAALAILISVVPCAAQSAKSTPATAGAPSSAAGSTPLDNAQLLKATEAFVRELFAWGPAMQVKLGPLSPARVSDFYLVPIHVTLNNQEESGEVYVSKDGKTLLRGDMYDMQADPFAANRAKMHLEGSPAKGPANARVTLVEFADFECPHCAALYQNLKSLEQRYPQMRIVYKDFPIVQMHPWAQTAAIGGRCAYEQSPLSFWKVHDLIFENQDLISTENIWDKLVEYASGAGLDAAAFKACLASPDAQKAVEASRTEGVALEVSSTPTVFINGRPIPGGDPNAIEQYIEFELASSKR